MAVEIHPTSKQWKNLTVKLNRLRSQQIVAQNKIVNSSKTERRKRTRTLIQIGGLVNMVGLTERCGIIEGEDLQLDILTQDKAALLLGMLVTLEEQLPPSLSPDQEQAFKQKGINAFKFYFAQKEHKKTGID